MAINSLEIKEKTNYDLDNICYIDDFDVNSLKITKKESRIGANIYYTRCALNLDDDAIIPLHFLIDRLIGFIEEIDGSSDKYLVLKTDSTLWTDPKRIINLLDFDPKKLGIYTELNSISNAPDVSSKDLIEVYEVRYGDGGFYLVIDDIKGYFNVDDNVGSILNMILTDDQKNKYHEVWKEIFNDGNGELMLHEKIRLIDSDFPIEKIFKIHSITIAIKSLIEKDNKFYLELALNRCLFEPYEIKL